MFAKKQIRSFKLILILACLLLLAVDIRAQKITGKQTNDAEDVRTALNKLVDGLFWKIKQNLHFWKKQIPLGFVKRLKFKVVS